MRRLLQATLAVLMLVALVAAPAAAGGVIRDTAVQDFFYEDADAGLVLLTGPTFEEGCRSEGFTRAPRISWQANDGTYSSRFLARGIDLYLFEAPSFGALISQACGAVFGGGQVPEPIAVGTASYLAAVSGQTDLIIDGGPEQTGQTGQPNSRYANVTWGWLEFSDGSRATVRASAVGEFAADGLEQVEFNVVIRPRR